MKIKTLVPILLGFVLAAGIGVYAYQKNAPGKEEYMAAAIAYLEEQKTALDGAETIPMDIDWATGRVIRIHADSPYTIDRIISYLTNVTEVCRVEDIPELAYPLVYVGDKISGNNEKLYYSADKKILEFTLSETDSLAFLLYLTGSGSLYPEIKEFFIEGVIRQLQNEINFGDSDILKFSNGHLESIDIKTQETAEVLFECIRNCVQINDLTDVSLEPMALPILVNGRGAGTFEMFFATYQETGQFICISFAPEDSARFQDYVMELQKRYGVSIGTDDWFKDDVQYVYEKGLMLGTGEGTFSPYLNTTRGMIVTILYRLEGKPVASDSRPFDDVESGKYYEKAISWAVENHIIEGYGNGKFGPEDDISREQMATILYNYAKFKGYDVSKMTDLSRVYLKTPNAPGQRAFLRCAASFFLEIRQYSCEKMSCATQKSLAAGHIMSFQIHPRFTDSNKISVWASTPLAWANAEGLINSKGDGILDPGGNALRCEVAAILHGFEGKIVK